MKNDSLWFIHVISTSLFLCSCSRGYLYVLLITIKVWKGTSTCCMEMETNQHYCTAFVRTNNVPYQYETSMQWTAPHDRNNTNMAECQTAWSLSPFFYSTGNHSCMCSRYKPFNSFGDNSTFSHDHNSLQNLEKTEGKRRDNTSSISKMLKFGIERILTDKNSFENDAG